MHLHTCTIIGSITAPFVCYASCLWWWYTSYIQIEKLDGQLRLKDEELSRLRQLHSDEVARLSEELRALRDNYEQKMHEYEELMDLKIQLDQEIATYRALLQEEETRYFLHVVVDYCMYIYISQECAQEFLSDG